MSFNNINVNVSGSKSIIKALQTYNTVILKPNIIDNRNVLTQEMISEKHTKYIIKWNYSLEDETIIVPKDCIIEFAGGTIDNGIIVGNNTIMIYSKPIDEVCPAERQGTFIYNTTITDEEDITSESGQLKFKDKPAIDGMGRKILRKNIVDGKNILTQAMINEPNTRYVIQYDFDLNEQKITIPEDCILDFQGGSLSNGTINFNNTKINYSSSTPIIFNSININNNIFNDIIIADWFDDTLANIINKYSTIYNIECINVYYDIEQPIIIGKKGKKAKSVIFKNRTILNATNIIDTFITLQSVSTHSLYLLNNIYIKGNNKINTAINVNDCTRILLKDIVIYDFLNKGVELENCRADLDNLYIESNANENTNITGLYMNAGDCTASNIEMCNLNKNVVVLQGNNRFFRIHGWINSTLTKEYWDTTCLFFIKTSSYTIINDCISDSPKNFIQADDSIGQNWSKIICTDCGMMYYNRDDISNIIHNNKSCAFNKTSNVTINCYNFCVYWYTKDELDITNNVAPGDIVRIAGNTTHGTERQYENNITGAFDYNNIEWHSTNNERYITHGNIKERILRYAGNRSTFANNYSDGDFMMYNGIPRWFNGSSWVDEKGFLARYLRHGTSKNRPSDLTSEQLSFEYYDQTINLPIIWDGSKFINYLGCTPTLTKGETSIRPNYLTEADKGVYYFDTTLNKPIWWNGTAWVDATGASV